MRDPAGLEKRLAEAGLDAVTASRLAAALAGDASSILPGAGTAEPLILAAIVAAGDPHLVGQALPLLLAALDRHGDDLDDFERGVLWHLRGLAAWRAAGDVAAATAALNHGIELLLGHADPRAAAYVGRVLDTSGQVLHHQGLLADARLEFERSLALKEAASDDAGTALTLGNLGRLCMELGDFRAGAGHLQRDLDHVNATAPGMTRLRGQLLTQLGVCRAELDDPVGAAGLLAASEALAREGGDGVGLAFATVHLGRFALRRDDVEEAAHRATKPVATWPRSRPPRGRPARPRLPPRRRGGVGTRGTGAALERFAEARAAYAAASRVSPVEHAELLETWARACAEDGRARDAAQLLQQALRHLDATTAEALRARIDARLKALDESTWLLHSAGRFVGHGQIELLLEAGGPGRFPGRREEVTVLFSDIRGFTGVSERLAPDALIVRAEPVPRPT